MTTSTGNDLTLKGADEVMSAGRIKCLKCSGYRSREVLGRQVRVLCDCQKVEALERKQLKDRLELVERRKKASQLGERYKEVSFETSDVYSADYETIFKRCKKYTEVAEEVLKRGIGIYLHGKSGVGKTHLAACMANALMESYYTILYTNVADIAKRIRSTYGRKRRPLDTGDFMDRLSGVDFLFIDDFGTELVTKDNQDTWLQEKIFEVINARYNSKLPIIFTSNYSLKELHTDRGVAKKTIDRMAETCEPMLLKGDSYRPKVKARNDGIF